MKSQGTAFVVAQLVVLVALGTTGVALLGWVIGAGYAGQRCGLVGSAVIVTLAGVKVIGWVVRGLRQSSCRVGAR